MASRRERAGRGYAAALGLLALAALFVLFGPGGAAGDSRFSNINPEKRALQAPPPQPSSLPSPAPEVSPTVKAKKPVFTEDQSFGSPDDADAVPSPIPTLPPEAAPEPSPAPTPEDIFNPQDEDKLILERMKKATDAGKAIESSTESQVRGGPEAQNPEGAPQQPELARRLLDVPKDVITELILDASGSMKAKIQSRTKLFQAKRVLRAFMTQAHSDNMVLGLRVYGLKPRDCKNTKLALNFGEKGADAIDAAMSVVDPKGYGKTPLALSLEHAEKDLKKFPGKPRRIIVVTDGMDTCKGDPCKVAQRLAKEFDIRIYVVGYGLESEDKEKLACMKDLGGMFDAGDLGGLAGAMSALSQNKDKNLFVKSPDPIGISEVYKIDPKAASARARRVKVAQFVSPLGTHVEPGVEYEVVVNLKPKFTFKKVILQPNEKRTLVVTGKGKVNITFMKQLFTIELLDEGGRPVATFPSDTPTDVPTALYKVRATAPPFSEVTIDDIMVAPNGAYTESIKGFGALQVNTPDRGPGPFGMYVFDDHIKKDIGSYLTSMPLVLPVGRYTIKSVGNSILRNIYPDAKKLFEVPLPPPGQTVTFARKETKEEIAKEDKEAAASGHPAPVMLDQLTPEQIRQHLEEQEKNGLAAPEGH